MSDRMNESAFKTVANATVKGYEVFKDYNEDNDTYRVYTWLGRYRLTMKQTGSKIDGSVQFDEGTVSSDFEVRVTPKIMLTAINDDFEEVVDVEVYGGTTGNISVDNYGVVLNAVKGAYDAANEVKEMVPAIRELMNDKFSELYVP